MGSMDSAFGGSSFEDGFEPDDFYESFLAPKFHDFTAPEELIDPDVYFMAKPGMLKKAFGPVENVKPACATKIHKVHKEAPKMVAPPKSPIAPEKSASCTGSAKETIRVIATSVTPLASKPQLKNGSMAHSPMHEKHNNNNNAAADTASNGSLKLTSIVKKLQTSENDDPNSPINNSPDVAAAPKPAKQQRSIKAQEEKPTALTRQRSIKAQEESKPAALTRQRSQNVLETKPVVERKTSVESNTSMDKAKTPLKSEAAEAAVGSGHHCKSSRCAAKDPTFASPVPTKKYLVAKKGTPGSLRKATTPENELDGGKVVKVALDVFQKMALDPEKNQVLSSSEVKGLEEVLLQEEKGAISGDEIREWARRSVSFEEEKAAVSQKCTEGKKQEQQGIETFLKVASECLENINLEMFVLPPISKQGKKRKSEELMQAGASKRANCSSDETRNKAISKKISLVNQQAAAAAATAKIPKKLRMRRLSVAKRLSIVRTGSRVTNPRPFRLRTQERGAMKEKEFIKKVEEYKAAKEGFYSAFQGLAVTEPKIPAKFLRPGHVFSAKRAELPKPQDDEAKAMNNAGLPLAHKAPLFDHPFKPHRSTKKLTVPQEPKFHTARGSRNCPSHAVAV